MVFNKHENKKQQNVAMDFSFRGGGCINTREITPANIDFLNQCLIKIQGLVFEMIQQTFLSPIKLRITAQFINENMK